MGLKPDELRRIEYMPLPQPFERRSGNKVLAPALLAEESDICFELFECFT
jgi:hypothetical protein